MKGMRRPGYAPTLGECMAMVKADRDERAMAMAMLDLAIMTAEKTAETAAKPTVVVKKN